MLYCSPLFSLIRTRQLHFWSLLGFPIPGGILAMAPADARWISVLRGKKQQKTRDRPSKGPSLQRVWVILANKAYEVSNAQCGEGSVLRGAEDSLVALLRTGIASSSNSVCPSAKTPSYGKHKRRIMGNTWYIWHVRMHCQTMFQMDHGRTPIHSEPLLSAFPPGPSQVATLRKAREHHGLGELRVQR